MLAVSFIVLEIHICLATLHPRALVHAGTSSSSLKSCLQLTIDLKPAFLVCTVQGALD